MTTEFLQPLIVCCGWQARAATGFSLFVKERFASAKVECGGVGTPHKLVMSRLSAQWAEQKSAAVTLGMGALRIG